MPDHLRDTSARDRSLLRSLHEEKQRKDVLDDPRIDWRRTAAGCLAVIGLLGAGVIVGRCSAPAAAQPRGEAVTLTLADTVDTAALDAAIADSLDQYLTSITTTTTRPRSAAAPAAVPAASTPSGDRWDQLAICESGGRWDYPPVSGGFSGGIMFHIGTWRAMGGEEFAPDAYQATREQQIIVAERVLATSGWRAWPGCSRKFGWL